LAQTSKITMAEIGNAEKEEEAKTSAASKEIQSFSEASQNYIQSWAKKYPTAAEIP
jgi:hypothetical protein